MKIKLSAQLKHLLTKELFCHQALVREFFTRILPLNQFLKIKITFNVHSDRIFRMVQSCIFGAKYESIEIAN